MVLCCQRKRVESKEFVHAMAQQELSQVVQYERGIFQIRGIHLNHFQTSQSASYVLDHSPRTVVDIRSRWVARRSVGTPSLISIAGGFIVEQKLEVLKTNVSRSIFFQYGLINYCRCRIEQFEVVLTIVPKLSHVAINSLKN